jgi:hypothetical protein
MAEDTFTGAYAQYSSIPDVNDFLSSAPTWIVQSEDRASNIVISARSEGGGRFRFTIVLDDQPPLIYTASVRLQLPEWRMILQDTKDGEERRYIADDAKSPPRVSVVHHVDASKATEVRALQCVSKLPTPSTPYAETLIWRDRMTRPLNFVFYQEEAYKYIGAGSIRFISSLRSIDLPRSMLADPAEWHRTAAVIVDGLHVIGFNYGAMRKVFLVDPDAEYKHVAMRTLFQGLMGPSPLGQKPFLPFKTAPAAADVKMEAPQKPTEDVKMEAPPAEASPPERKMPYHETINRLGRALQTEWVLEEFRQRYPFYSITPVRANELLQGDTDEPKTVGERAFYIMFCAT